MTTATKCRRCRLPDSVGPQHLRACPYWKGRRVVAALASLTVLPEQAPRRPKPGPTFLAADVMRILRASEDPLTLEQLAQRAGFRQAAILHQQVIQALVHAGRVERLKPRVGPALYQVPWEDDE